MRRAIRDHAVAAAWGFAEGTVFFIVPDVWMSGVALRKPKRALLTTLSATAGAMAAGAVMHRWGRRVPAEQSRAALLRIPLITPEMIDEVETALATQGYRAMLSGPIRGIPYKIYARSAGAEQRDLGGLLAWSPPARLPRFTVASAAAATAGALARKRWPDRGDQYAARGFAAAWLGFYAVYFATVGRSRPWLVHRGQPGREGE